MQQSGGVGLSKEGSRSFGGQINKATIERKRNKLPIVIREI